MSTLCQCPKHQLKTMAKIKLIFPKCLLYFSPKLATTQPFVQNMLTSLLLYVILHGREILNNRGWKASDAGMVLFSCICRPIIKGGATSSLSKDGISQQPINKDGIRKSVTAISGICIYEDPPPQCINLFLVFQMNLFSTNGSKAYVLNPSSTNRRKTFIFDISICLLEMNEMRKKRTSDSFPRLGK